MPCKFENNLHGSKDMIAYYMLYNFTLAPSNFVTSWNKPLTVDIALLSLKTALDNSVLELKATEKGLNFIPKINTTY